MDPEKFYLMLSDNDAFLTFLREHGVLNLIGENSCLLCNKVLKQKFKKRKDGDYSFLYRCNTCKNEHSMFRNTFFATQRSHGVTQKIAPKKILKLVFMYFEKKTHKEMKEHIGIRDNNTMVNWCNYIRDIMTLTRIKSEKLGGLGKRVQIDESLFRGRRKYHRGRMLLGDFDVENRADADLRRRNYGDRINGPWVFGLVEEETNKVRMFYVEKRDASTLIPIIMANIEVGTTIISDGWAAYNRIQFMGFNHEVVVHEENFVDPITGANTQRIECEWSHAKLLIMRLRRGTTVDLIQSHLDEYTFRKMYGNDAFFKWLELSNTINYN